MNTPCLRSHLGHLQFPGDTMKSLHRLTKCRRCWWRCIIRHLRLMNSWNHRFGPPILLIPPMEVVGCITPAWLRQFVKLNLLVLEMLHAMPYRFRDCAHHPARFVIFAELGPRRIFFLIILVFRILLMVGTYKITQTIADGGQHLMKYRFRLGGCQSRLFSIYHIILPLCYCCLCVFDSLSCHSGLSFHIILDTFLLLIVV